MSIKILLLKQTLRIGEAATILGLSSRTIARYLESGKLPSIRLPSGQRRIRTADVRPFL